MRQREKKHRTTVLFFRLYRPERMPRMDTVFITLASALAGFVDASVGGGGLVLVPALFATYPSVLPATLLGTNKSASVWGTLFAAWRYQQQLVLQWRALRVAALCALAGACAGAYTLTLLSPQLLRQTLPLLLLVVLIYTLKNKHFGQAHQPRFDGRTQTIAMSLCAGVIGFYDGFLGPGTGSLLLFVLVRWLGFDFLQASAHSKLLNLASNVAAMVWLGWQGHVLWEICLPIAVANIAGSWLGTRMALRQGNNYVRWLFSAVVAALLLKTAYDAGLAYRIIVSG
jgi:uncharacterized membrane protein YfcA